MWKRLVVRKIGKGRRCNKRGIKPLPDETTRQRCSPTLPLVNNGDEWRLLHANTTKKNIAADAFELLASPPVAFNGIQWQLSREAVAASLFSGVCLARLSRC